MGALVTQSGAEVLAQGAAEGTARITQAGVELLGVGVNEGSARISQSGIEVLSHGLSEGAARVSQSGIELLVLGLSEGSARITLSGVEVIARGARDGSARVSLVGVEAIFEDTSYITPLEPPAHCGLEVSADGGVAVPVTYIPVEAEARGDYTVGSTAPPLESGDWTFFGRTGTEATLTTPAVEAGSTVWVRLRSEKSGSDPSAWTDPESIVV